ncbi:MAG: hypothetical protein ACKO0Z_22355 [Betaproteobacteria bacterium]
MSESGRLTVVVDLIGQDAYGQMLSWYGVRRISIPFSTDKAGELIEVIGLEQTEKLIEKYGGMRISLNLFNRARNYRKQQVELNLAKRQGETIREIAEKSSCTSRFVWQIAAQTKANQ